MLIAQLLTLYVMLFLAVVERVPVMLTAIASQQLLFAIWQQHLLLETVLLLLQVLALQEMLVLNTRTVLHKRLYVELTQPQ